jgi:(2Fe-2S) ferredoxin
MSKRLILVCNSAHAKLSESACCQARGADKLLERFQEKIDDAGLGDQIILKPSACMKNCQNGISVKIHPDQTLYGKVTEQMLDKIIKEHLVGGTPVKALKAERTKTILDF